MELPLVASDLFFLRKTRLADHPVPPTCPRTPWNPGKEANHHKTMWMFFCPSSTTSLLSYKQNVCVYVCVLGRKMKVFWMRSTHQRNVAVLSCPRFQKMSDCSSSYWVKLLSLYYMGLYIEGKQCIVKIYNRFRGKLEKYKLLKKETPGRKVGMKSFLLYFYLYNFFLFFAHLCLLYVEVGKKLNVGSKMLLQNLIYQLCLFSIWFKLCQLEPNQKPWPEPTWTDGDLVHFLLQFLWNSLRKLLLMRSSLLVGQSLMRCWNAHHSRFFMWV